MQFQKISLHVRPSQKELEFPEGWGGGFCKAKKFNTSMKLNWNFQSGGRVLKKIPSVREVWLFSRITQCVWLCKNLSLVVVVVAVND